MYKQAMFAGGCFWGMQYFLEKLPGVIKTEVGYSGGAVDNPTYQAVCRGDTGHYEVVQVTYDPNKVNYETLAKCFFEIHDPTQSDGQGVDVGQQYQSAVFYYDEMQKIAAENLITILKNQGLNVVTKVLSAEQFWPAETYHQHYYEQRGDSPSCHAFTKRF